jgi:5'-nucleotidase/UDP-sugar diphosphatase
VLSELPFGNATDDGRDHRQGREGRDRERPGAPPRRAPGRFPVVSGLTFEADHQAAAVGSARRVRSRVEGKPIDRGGEVHRGLQQLHAGGRRRLHLRWRRGRTLIGLTDGKLMANEVMVYVRRLGTVDAKVEGRAVLK